MGSNPAKLAVLFPVCVNLFVFTEHDNPDIQTVATTETSFV